jgi:DNA-binding MarR family transcriptional regulator
MATAPRPGQPGKPAGRGKARFAEINALVDYTLAGLTPVEISVWIIIWRDTKPAGTAQTSQTDIARRAGMTVRGVQKAIRRLASHGLVKVVRSGKLRGRASVYKVRAVAG